MERFAMNDTPQSKGGKSRARSLTTDQRRQIARQAAQARWARISDPTRLPVATHYAPLQIGTVTVDAYRLDDGRRMLSKAAMAAALGLQSKGGNAFVRSLTRPALRGRLSDALWQTIANPQHFKRHP